MTGLEEFKGVIELTLEGFARSRSKFCNLNERLCYPITWPGSAKGKFSWYSMGNRLVRF